MIPTALLHGFALTLDLAGIVALLALTAVLIWLEAKRESRLPDVEIEVEEREDWPWPVRRVGPVGRARIDDRPSQRRAA